MVENILFRKGLREIKENLKQYITVIIIAILAVSLFTGIYANWQDFRYKVDTIYENGNMCDSIILSTKNSEELRNYLDNSDIYYEERAYMPVLVNSSNANIVTFTPESTLNKPAYMSKESLASNDFLVDEMFLERNELAIGDSIEVYIETFDFNGISVNDIILNLTITGTMTHPEALDNSNYQADLLYVGINAIVGSVYNYLQTSNIPGANYVTENMILNTITSSYNQFLIKGDADLDYINTNFDVIYALDREDLPTNLNIEADILQAKQLIYIFPIIFYLVALLIILTSISDLINKEQKNIGLLKALGYSNFEILMHYTNIFVILCLIGGIIGIIVGPILIPAVMNQKYKILYQLPNIATPIFRPFYLISVVVLILIVYLTAIFALYSILKKVPASSIRGENSYNMKPTTFDKLPIKKDKFLTLRMALRNMKRKVSRTFMVLFGVMGCSALLLCGFGIEDTLNNSIDCELELIPYDISVSYNKNGSLASELSQADNIKELDEYTKVNINVLHDKMITSYLYILPESSHIFVPTYNKDTCMLSSKVASEIGANVGDTITFIYSQTSYELVVTDILEISFSQGVFISVENPIISIEPTNCWIRTIDNTKNEETLNYLIDNYSIYDGQTIEEVTNTANDRLSSIRIMTNTIKAFAIVLAIVVLYNLALLNFKERIKDIATLKVLGFSIHEIGASFLLEIIILIVVASLIGLALGYPLMYAVLVINENPLLTYIYHINTISYLITLCLTVGFGIIINIIMSTFTNKVEMVESLKAVD